MLTLLRALFLPVLLLALPATSTAAGEAAVLAGFEKGSPQPLRLNAATGSVASGDAAEGERFLQLKPNPDAAPGIAYVRLPVSETLNFAAHSRLTAQLRAPEQDQELRLTWLALDATGHPIFQQSLELKPDSRWTKHQWPLHLWRWDQRRLADWDEIREIVLRIDSAGVQRVDIDDIQLEGTRNPAASAQWLLDLAFGADEPRMVVAKDGLLVATDAVDGFAQADLHRLLEDMTRTRAFVRRVFGSAVRPTDDLTIPATLLIFRSDERRLQFFRRLGVQWHATITEPSAQGYTVQDIATATYRPELGVRRPVYLHESAHAVVARDLRLLTGHAPHTALQEGLASYLQLCVHPQSIDRNLYAKAFADPVDAEGGSFFKPIEQLFQTRVNASHYAQLASLVAYLVETDPQLLQELAKGLAAGESASDILLRHGTDWQRVQDAWLVWGRNHFAKLPQKDPHVFEAPAEFQ